MYSAMETGLIDEVDTLLSEMATIAARTGLVRHRWQVASNRSWRHLLAGRIDDAERESGEALDIGTEGDLPYATGTYGAQLLRIQLERGRLAEIIDLVVQAVADNPTITGWEPGLMFLYCELERYDDAATLFERLLPYRNRVAFLNAGEYGAVARSTGRLATLMGRYDDAEDLLAEALATHERLAAPYWTARTQLDLAERAVARGGPGDADATCDLLDDVQRAVDHYGYAGLQRRIDKLRDRS